MSKAIDSVPA